MNNMLSNLNETSDLPEPVQSGLRLVLEEFDTMDNEIALWQPNPFQGWNTPANVDVSISILPTLH